VQGRIHVAGPCGGLTANVKVRPRVKPTPKLRGVFQHAALNVDFLDLVTRETPNQAGRDVRPLPQAVSCSSYRKSVARFLITEEKPVFFSGCACDFAFFQKGAEWGNSGAGSNHDNGCFAVHWQFEAGRRLHEHFYELRLANAVGQKYRGDSVAGAAVAMVTNGAARSNALRQDAPWGRTRCCRVGVIAFSKRHKLDRGSGSGNNWSRSMT